MSSSLTFWKHLSKYSIKLQQILGQYNKGSEIIKKKHPTIANDILVYGSNIIKLAKGITHSIQLRIN